MLKEFSAQLDQGIGPEGFPGRTRPGEPELVMLPSPGFETGESEAGSAGLPCRFQSQIEAGIIFNATSVADKPDGYGSLAHKRSSAGIYGFAATLRRAFGPDSLCVDIQKASHR